jgi:hypothetical protein
MKALVLLPFLLILGGCASGPIITQTVIPDCEGRACFTEMRGSMAGRGGGILSMSGITTVGESGEQNFTPVVDAAMPDRLDTLGPAALTSYGSYRSARRHSIAIERAAENSAPGLILMNDNSSAAAAVTNTEVGITQQILQENLPAVRFGHHK